MAENRKVRENEQRPILISICCISAFVNAVSGDQTIRDTVFDLYNTLSIVIVLLCVIGLWRMKFFAVFMYLSVFIVNQMMLLLIDRWILFQAILPSLIIIICFTYLKKMS